MADEELDDLTPVPLPGEESKQEHDRVRRSNDHDQQLEREGKRARHNEGYDETAKGKLPRPEVERVVEE
jgi:hypothetical protein